MNNLTQTERMQVDSLVGGLRPALSAPNVDKRLMSIALIQLAKELYAPSESLVEVSNDIS